MGRAGAFVWLPHAGEVPTRAVRFAIGDPARQLVSGVWTVRGDRRGGFHIMGAGGFGLTRLVLRRRGLAFSHADDGDEAIVGRAIAEGPRRDRWLPAPERDSWHVLSLSFPFEFLRRTPGPPGDPARRPMIQLPQAERGRMYRVAFLLTESAAGRVDYEDPSDRYLGRVTDGRGRNLLLIGRVVESDLTGLSARLSRLSPRQPLRLHSRGGADPADERGLILFDPAADHLDLIELHNLRREPLSPTPGSPRAPSQLQLALD